MTKSSRKTCDVSGVILAGGQSHRMGSNKALLRINGKRLIDRVASVLCGIFNEVIIVGDNLDTDIPFNLPVFKDLSPGSGSLGGIYTGLHQCNSPRAFCAACDMPFLSEQLIRFLIKIDPDADVVIPRVKDGVQPLHAVYSTNCIPFIRKSLDQNHFKIIDFFSNVRVREVSEEEIYRQGCNQAGFFNINTKEDLAEALRLVRKKENIKPQVL